MRAAVRGAAVLGLLLLACLEQPRHVDRLIIVNPTAYELAVEVTGEGRDGWLPLGVVPARSEHVVREVVDQGDVWIFGVRHWGEPVGEFSVTRNDLEGTGWRVDVPREVGERLQELGRPPT